MNKYNDYLQEIGRIDTPVIPLKLHLYWHSKELPKNMQDNVNLLKLTNPEFEVILYDDEKAIDFLKNNFDEEVLNAYESLIPISFKSDLFRFCVLYIEGGIYLDIKFKPLNNFKLIYLSKYDEVWSHEGRIANGKVLHYGPDPRFINKCIVNTGIIISKPNNSHLQIAINNILYNVKNKVKGLLPSIPTGPCLLTMSFNYDVMKNEKFKLKTKFIGDYAIIYITGNNDEMILPIFQFYKSYRNEQKDKSPQPHWIKLWEENKIYK